MTKYKQNNIISPFRSIETRSVSVQKKFKMFINILLVDDNYFNIMILENFIKKMNKEIKK